MKVVLKDILEPMIHLTQACFVTGSQRHDLSKLNKDRDVDLFFLVENKDHRIGAALQMQIIQTNSDLLLHPTIVTVKQFTNNPLFSDLIDDGVRLW